MINQQIVKDYFNGDDYTVVEYHFVNGRLLCNVKENIGTYLNQLYRGYYYLIMSSYINKCRYSIDSMAYLKYLHSRLKYDRNTRDAQQELKDNILGEDIIKVLKEFRDGDL
jgi:hypothetical protein